LTSKRAIYIEIAFFWPDPSSIRYVKALWRPVVQAAVASEKSVSWSPGG